MDHYDRHPNAMFKTQDPRIFQLHQTSIDIRTDNTVKNTDTNGRNTDINKASTTQIQKDNGHEVNSPFEGTNKMRRRSSSISSTMKGEKQTWQIVLDEEEADFLDSIDQLIPTVTSHKDTNTNRDQATKGTESTRETSQTWHKVLDKSESATENQFRPIGNVQPSTASVQNMNSTEQDSTNQLIGIIKRTETQEPDVDNGKHLNDKQSNIHDKNNATSTTTSRNVKENYHKSFIRKAESLDKKDVKNLLLQSIATRQSSAVTHRDQKETPDGRHDQQLTGGIIRQTEKQNFLNKNEYAQFCPIGIRSPVEIHGKEDVINEKEYDIRQQTKKQEDKIDEKMHRPLLVETHNHKNTKLDKRKDDLKLTGDNNVQAALEKKEASQPMDKQLLVDVHHQDNKIKKKEDNLTILSKQTILNEEQENEEDQLLPMDKQLLIDIHDNKMKKVQEENVGAHRVRTPVNRQLSVTPPPFGSPRIDTITPGM